MFTEFLNAYGMEIISALFIAIFGGFGIAIKRLVAKYVNNDTLRAIAKTAMLAVEQLYKELHGESKMNEALKIAAKLLTEKGITVNTDEMRLLIEAAVAEFNARYKSEKRNKYIAESSEPAANATE